MVTTILEAGKPGARHKYALVSAPPFWFVEEREEGVHARSFPVAESHARALCELPEDEKPHALWRLYHLCRLEAKSSSLSWSGGPDACAS
jgi:hypothetical protein